VRRLLKHAGKRGRHECFAEADDIAQNHAAAFLKVPRGDADGGGLEVEQRAAHVRGDGKFGLVVLRGVESSDGEKCRNLCALTVVAPSFIRFGSNTGCNRK
jgi:hypothetical protein